jgi:hypothetical protein
MTTYRRSLPFKESPMKHSRRGLAASAVITLGLVGVSLPAAAKDGISGGSSSSTTSVSAPKSSEKPSSSSAAPAPGTPASSVATSSTSGGATSAPKSSPTAPSGDRARQEAITSLDSLARKIKASRLDDATKAAFLARVADLKAAIVAGTLPPKGSLDTLRHDIEAAAEALGGGSSSSSTPGTSGKHSGSDDGPETSEVKHDEAKTEVEKGPHPRERAQASLQANIDKVNASNLPDDVKAKVIAALTNAKDHLQGVDDTVDAKHAAEKVKEQIEHEKASRLADMKARMAAVADRVQVAIDKAAAVPGSEAAIVAANAALATARVQLDAASNPAELRAVWQALRVIRKGLPHLPESTTTTSIPATTVPATTTTVAEATTTTVLP